MKPAIRIENIAKRYRLGTAVRSPHHTLAETLSQGMRDAVRRIRSPRRSNRGAPNDFWALNDVSFEVRPGEVVGIVGRNGAGKSTLLKILSRIVEPTAGRIEVRGRMGSLLEVGTGFHPELSGRENIYLNGSILGMTRREIDRKFDEIVAFAEIDRFLDTPVKRYSSGMYVRLAFAVAAHLEPEILIVDEVLAVGDATFQKRCLDRIAALASGGRTILFVSHNLQVVPRLCGRAVRLDRGRVADIGPAERVVKGYLEDMLVDARGGDLREKPRSGDGRARFVRAWLAGPDGNATTEFRSGDDLTVRVEVESSVNARDVALAIVVQTIHGSRVITSWTRESGFTVDLRTGRQGFECRFRDVPLRPGHTVMLGLWMSDAEVMDSVENAVTIDVLADLRRPHLSANPDQGVVVCDYAWRSIDPSPEALPPLEACR